MKEINSDDKHVDTTAEVVSDDFIGQALDERRDHQPPISLEQLKKNLKREVILYVLEKLRERELLGQAVYENAVTIALKS